MENKLDKELIIKSFFNNPILRPDILTLKFSHEINFNKDFINEMSDKDLIEFLKNELIKIRNRIVNNINYKLSRIDLVNEKEEI
jgi:hypothetical protein